jgi:hypothetical protein
MTKRLKALVAGGLITAGFSAMLELTGCAYRLMPLTRPTQQRIHILANSPEQYSVRVQASDHRVQADGRVSFDTPMIRSGCSVYLFNQIPIRKAPDLSKTKLISIMTSGKTVETLSLRDLSKLPLDSAGYRQLTFSQSAKKH